MLSVQDHACISTAVDAWSYALNVCVIFLSFFSDLLHCLSVAAAMNRYAFSPCMTDSPYPLSSGWSPCFPADTGSLHNTAQIIKLHRLARFWCAHTSLYFSTYRACNKQYNHSAQHLKRSLHGLQGPDRSANMQAISDCTCRDTALRKPIRQS